VIVFRLATLALSLLLLDGTILIPPVTSVVRAQVSASWQLVYTNGAFFQRVLSPAVYDPTHARFEIFGGSGEGAVYGDTFFFYPSNNTFVHVNPTVHPSPRYAPAVSFDDACGCAVLFGGAYKQSEFSTEYKYNDTWLFFSSNDSWVQVPTDIAPSARHLATMMYDPSAKINLLFGGTDGLIYNDLWGFNTSKLTWTLLQNYTLVGNLTNRPLNRFAYGMATAVVPNSFLMFGGGSINFRLLQSQIHEIEEINDTWAYSYSQQKWSNLTSAIHPSGRTFPAMASSTDGLTVMFGGSAEWDPLTTTNYLSDTWVFDQNTSSWHQLNITGPPALFGASLGYDPIGKSFLLFGGESEDGVLSDVWRLNASLILSLIGNESTTSNSSESTTVEISHSSPNFSASSVSMVSTRFTSASSSTAVTGSNYTSLLVAGVVVVVIAITAGGLLLGTRRTRTMRKASD
jgi:N-acetylneuraminic acid mutarotase